MVEVGTDETFSALLDVYEGAAFVVDAEGRYVEVIGAESDDDLLYDDAASLEGKRFHDVLAAETADRFVDAVERALGSGSPAVIEYEMTVPAGDRWFEASIAPIPTEEGEPTHVLWVARDITERRHHRQALTSLHEAGTRLTTSESVEAVCEEAIHAAESILEFDRSMIALEADGVLRAVETSEGLPEDATAEIPIDEAIAGKTYRTGESHLTPDLQEEPAARSQERYRSGLSLPVGEHGVFQAVAEEPEAFDDRDLELGELFVAQVDATLTRIRHEQELQRRNERLDEFASIVSHDLQNPLSVATGHLELAREDCESEHLERVAAAHDRMESLIEDLLVLAQTGADGSNTEPVDLAALVEECWAVVASSSATLSVETERTVRANPNRLKQLVENLLANAVEHGGEAITVGDTADGFYVADDGPGIPEVTRDRIFDAGFSDADEGTGFGLHIVESIAESHGWEVGIGEGPDGGARFEITGVEEA